MFVVDVHISIIPLLPFPENRQFLQPWNLCASSFWTQKSVRNPVCVQWLPELYKSFLIMWYVHNLIKSISKSLRGSDGKNCQYIAVYKFLETAAKHQMYGHLPPISQTFQVRRTRHAEYWWGSKDELIHNVLSSVRILGAVKRTWWEWWMIGTYGGERERDRDTHREREREREKEREKRFCVICLTWCWWWYISFFSFLFYRMTCVWH